jgi:hypothetical protein
MTIVGDPGIGSFFAYPNAEALVDGAGSNRRPEWPPGSWTLVNSGRAALAAIIGQHLTAHPNARLWAPSYYCRDVTHYIAQMLPVLTYPCRPTAPRLPSEIPPADLLLVASYFGAEPAHAQVPSAQLVLDITHDPLADWVPAYPAGWLFGSLRKTLPLPEGGFALAGQGGGPRLATPTPSVDSRLVVTRGAQAMLEKSRWIEGAGTTPKDSWYPALQAHESAMAALAPAAMQPESLDLLRRLPVRLWRTQRLANLRALRDALSAEMLAHALPATFGLPLVLPDADVAEATRKDLIRQGIYPALIWPQPDRASPEDSDLAERILLLHTDYRYTSTDMHRVAAILDGAHEAT